MNRRQFLQTLLGTAVAPLIPISWSAAETAVEADKWYHVAVARDPSELIDFFIDGVRVTKGVARYSNSFTPEFAGRDGSFTIESWVKFESPTKLTLNEKGICYGEQAKPVLTFSRGRSEES